MSTSLKYRATYKTSGVLVHHGSSAHGITESLGDKLGRGKIRKTLSEVHRVVGGCQLCELNPVGKTQ